MYVLYSSGSDTALPTSNNSSNHDGAVGEHLQNFIVLCMGLKIEQEDLKLMIFFPELIDVQSYKT